jgi:hypothetical protein
MGVLNERRELLAERRSVVRAQIDLIFRAADSEPDRLILRAPIKIVF